MPFKLSKKMIKLQQWYYQCQNCFSITLPSLQLGMGERVETLQCYNALSLTTMIDLNTIVLLLLCPLVGLSLKWKLESTHIGIWYRFPKGQLLRLRFLFLSLWHQLINSSRESSLNSLPKLFVQIHTVPCSRYKHASIWFLEKIQYVQQVPPATQIQNI